MNNSKLVNLFIANKFTKAELAKKCGISRPTVDNALNGGNIQVDTLEQLAKCFNVPVGYFFDDTKSSNSAIESHASVVAGNNITGSNNIVSLGKLTECKKEVEHLKCIIKEKESQLADKERMISLLMERK